jgi:succinate dehydrogenase/fumarate reductase-like Fe-S protein
METTAMARSDQSTIMALKGLDCFSMVKDLIVDVVVAIKEVGDLL